MNLVIKILDMLGSIISQFNLETPAGRKLHETAVSCLGKDVGDSGYGDAVDCAVSVNNIVFKAFGDYAGGDISTYRMYHAIKNNKKFREVRESLPGDIILSPSGHGNGRISNGHVGIMGENGQIMSNNSKNGLFEVTHTLSSWRAYYQIQGGYPVTFWRRIIN